jgi:hypothetical protein
MEEGVDMGNCRFVQTPSGVFLVPNDEEALDEIRINGEYLETMDPIRLNKNDNVDLGNGTQFVFQQDARASKNRPHASEPVSPKGSITPRPSNPTTSMTVKPPSPKTAQLPTNTRLVSKPLVMKASEP